MTADVDLLAAFDRIFGPVRPTPPRPISDDEQRAIDWAETRAEDARDDLFVSDSDARWMQQRADNWVEREAC